MGGRLWTIHKDTKNESNSQPLDGIAEQEERCELYTKIQKMKAIHNTPAAHGARILAVNYTQRYKKWKQFTTLTLTIRPILSLWTIHKDTKNESNSQQSATIGEMPKCCELYTKIQKMKAIHNRPFTLLWKSNAVNYTQRYKKWKQFTTLMMPLIICMRLWTIHKDTKNESNSQHTSPEEELF